MADRSRVRPFRTQAARRLTQWVASTVESGYTALAASTILVDQILTPADQPETIVRVRGKLNILSDQIATTERPFGAFGFAVVTNKAATLGPTAIPGPYAEAGDEVWFVHGFWHTPMQFLDATGVVVIAQTFEFDSKAMRKLDPDHRMVVMIENGATVGASYNIAFRMLLKAS